LIKINPVIGRFVDIFLICIKDQVLPTQFANL